MSKSEFFESNKSRFMLAAVLLVALTGCVGYAERRGGPNAYVTSSPRYDNVFMAQDDYVYYPGYQMYYGSRSHRYYSQEGSAWVARPAPAGISVDVLLAAPSVRMDFRDAPTAHHAQVIRTYPKTWSQSGKDHGQKADHKRKSKDNDH